jgi:ribose/xylose/arabinose/galactoside ABC-type transport system permease subunit
MQVALAITAPLAVIFSIRSLVVLALFVLAALLIGVTRVGRDVIAIGSDRRAALVAGVDVESLVVGVFAFSGLCASLSGALLSFALASASPAGLSDVIVPAAAAAIIGGVSLAGGTGRPLGIALGVLTLAVLHAGLNAIGAPPYVNNIAMGAILLVVAILDGPYLLRRLRRLRPGNA